MKFVCDKNCKVDSNISRIKKLEEEKDWVTTVGPMQMFLQKMWNPWITNNIEAILILIKQEPTQINRVKGHVIFN